MEHLQVNPERLWPLKILVWRLLYNAPPYNFLPLAPQHILPREDMVYGSDEHLEYLFYLCQFMHGAVSSDWVASEIRKLYQLSPELFTTASLLEIVSNRADLMRYIGSKIANPELSLGHFWKGKGETSKIVHYDWANNAYHLAELGLSVRELAGSFQDQKHAHSIMRSKGKRYQWKGFRCFGEKITSLFISWMQQFDACTKFPFVIPIDLHVRGLMYSLGVVMPEEGIIPSRENIDAKIRQMLLDFCQEEQIPATILSEAIWRLCSHLCKHNVQKQSINKKSRRKSNRAERKDRRKQLKITSFLRKAKVAEYTENNVGEQIDLYGKNLLGQCDRCPLEEFCRFLMLGGHYYDVGRCARVSKIVSGQKRLFDLT